MSEKYGYCVYEDMLSDGESIVLLGSLTGNICEGEVFDYSLIRKRFDEIMSENDIIFQSGVVSTSDLPRMIEVLQKEGWKERYIPIGP